MVWTVAAVAVTVAAVGAAMVVVTTVGMATPITFILCKPRLSCTTAAAAGTVITRAGGQQPCVDHGRDAVDHGCVDHG